MKVTEEAKIRMRTYYQKNRDKIKDNAKEYAGSHKVEIAAYRKKYYQNNKSRLDKKNRMYEQTPKAKDRKRQAYFKRKYRITQEYMDALLLKQRFLCPLCGRSLTDTKVVVDHNHMTGEVRGLLCYRCNTLLGQAEDSLSLLAKAMAYLRGI